MSATEATVAAPTEEVKVVETAVEPATTEAPAAEQPPTTEEVAAATVRFSILLSDSVSLFICRKHPRKKSPKLP